MPCLEKLQVFVEFFVIDDSFTFIYQIYAEVHKQYICGKEKADKDAFVKPVTEPRKEGINGGT